MDELRIHTHEQVQAPTNLQLAHKVQEEVEIVQTTDLKTRNRAQKNLDGEMVDGETTIDVDQ